VGECLFICNGMNAIKNKPKFISSISLFGLVIIFLAIISRLSCMQTGHYNYHCFAASSPTDLSLFNSYDRDVDVYLLDFSDKYGFGVVKKIHLKSIQGETICLENEGPITSGLYIHRESVTSKIKLSSQESNSFDLSDTTFNIDTPYELLSKIE
jgi:hypothetical protein